MRLDPPSALPWEPKLSIVHHVLVWKKAQGTGLMPMVSFPVFGNPWDHNSILSTRSAWPSQPPFSFSTHLIYRMGHYFRLFPLGCFWKILKLSIELCRSPFVSAPKRPIWGICEWLQEVPAMTVTWGEGVESDMGGPCRVSGRYRWSNWTLTYWELWEPTGDLAQGCPCWRE